MKTRIRPTRLAEPPGGPASPCSLGQDSRAKLGPLFPSREGDGSSRFMLHSPLRSHCGPAAESAGDHDRLDECCQTLISLDGYRFSIVAQHSEFP